SIERSAQHLLHVLREIAQLPIVRRRALLAREPRCEHTDLLGFVADALEIRDRLDHRDDQAQIPGSRRAGREDAAALLVDADLHLVDLRIVLGDLKPELAIGLGQRSHRAIELMLDETAHRQHRVADALEVLVEAPRDVVTQVFDFHRRLPAALAAAQRKVYDAYMAARAAA